MKFFGQYGQQMKVGTNHVVYIDSNICEVWNEVRDNVQGQSALLSYEAHQ